jgi:hypothetical protein
MEAASLSGMSVNFYDITRRNIPEDGIFEFNFGISPMMEAVRPSETWSIFTTLHTETSHKTVFTLTAVRT